MDIIMRYKISAFDLLSRSIIKLSISLMKPNTPEYHAITSEYLRTPVQYHKEFLL